jgi:hypothetical protein
MAREEDLEKVDVSGVPLAVGSIPLPAFPRISWGAIFGGAVAALAIWVLLYTLGLALGLSTVDPENPGSVRSSGLFTGIWSVITPLIALFVGGWVASQAAGVLDRKSGSIHGLVMWGVTLLLGAVLTFTALGSIIGGLASAGKTAVQAGGGALSGLAGQAGGAAQAFGLDADDALAPVNQRLQAEGKPRVTSSQVLAATRDVVQDAVRQGRIDRSLLVNSLSQNTALSPTDVEEVAGRIEMQWNQARARAGQMAERVQTGALRAADATGKAFWGVFAALLLGMIAAVGGALLGVQRRYREWQGTPARTTTVLRERPGHV